MVLWNPRAADAARPGVPKKDPMRLPVTRLILIGCTAMASSAMRASADIERVIRLTQSPSRYERTDFVVVLTADWSDPCRSEDVRLDMRLRSPSEKTVIVPAFLVRGSSGRPSVWSARYAPGEVGSYRGSFELVDGAGGRATAPISFAVSTSPSKGFLHAAGPWVLRFDDGTPFRGLGENLCWESRSTDDSRHFKDLQQSQRFNYDYMLGALASAGGQFTRIWMCPWNLPLEWRKVSRDTDRYRDDPGHFNPSAIDRMDRLVESLEAADVYAMLTLESHVALLGAGWDSSNYNLLNGGPCAEPGDFFTNAAAKAQFKNRLRYVVARWGYSTHLAAWEFFNEVDNAMYGQKPNRIPDADVTAWHREMGAYLKGLDPYGHLITTSTSHRPVEGLNQIEAFDFNQLHIYRRTGTIASAIRQSVQAEGKPCVVGEFGFEWDWSKDFNAFAWDMDNDFKEGAWLGLFSPTPVMPMSWWWEFFDERGMTGALAQIREVSDRMLKAGDGAFAEVPCSAQGLTCLAVRCGSTTFVYLSNPSREPRSGRPQVNIRHAATVDTLNPDARTQSAAPADAQADGSLRLPVYALGPGQRRILEIR